MHNNPYPPPPNQPPPSNNPTSAPPAASNYHLIRPFESGHTLALLAIAFLAVGILLDVFSIVSELLQINLLSDLVGGREVTSAEADANDLREMVIGITQMVNYLVTAVFFLMWFHRAHRNLPALGANHLEFTPAWAVGGFFVPFLNLVRPYKVAREIWKASSPGVGVNDGVSWEQVSGSPLLGFWWGAWIISNILGQLLSRLGRNAEGAEEFITLSWLGIAANLASLLAAALAILVIKKIDERQTEKHRLLMAVLVPQLGSPPPPQGGPSSLPQYAPPSYPPH